VIIIIEDPLANIFDEVEPVDDPTVVPETEEEEETVDDTSSSTDPTEEEDVPE